MPSLLVIEDDPKILRSLERGLRAEGYEVVAAATGEDGHRLTVRQRFDCLLEG
jgi:two-component system KDP operon response regulator KdpE